MMDIRSRLPFGMISSILAHTILVVISFQLTMDQQNQDIIEVSYYGDGGGTGLVEGPDTKMGEVKPSESAAWEQAQAGSPEGQPEILKEEVVKVPAPAPIPEPQPKAQTKPIEPVIAKAPPKAETKIETTTAEVPALKPAQSKPAVAKVIAMKETKPSVQAPTFLEEDPSDDESAAMIAAAQADFDRATSEAREEMAARQRARMNELAVSAPPRPVAPETVQDSLAAAQAALQQSGLRESPPAPAPPESQGEDKGSGAALSSSAPGHGGGGTPTGDGFVRNLADLQQMPGNQKPRYDVDERLKGYEGTVIFHAYISSEGVPSEIRIINNTGHRGLDRKSLAALKKWRFYPGQQGWVEVPFEWTLQGDAQEISPFRKDSGSPSESLDNEGEY